MLKGEAMKLRDVLEADPTITWIEATIRRDAKFVEEYCIGPGVEPGLSSLYFGECDLGTYVTYFGDLLTLYIDRKINTYDLPQKKRGLPAHGVDLAQIPAELLDLEVTFLAPSRRPADRNDDHGYRIDLQIGGVWQRLKGEWSDAQIEATFQHLPYKL